MSFEEYLKHLRIEYHVPRLRIWTFTQEHGTLVTVSHYIVMEYDSYPKIAINDVVDIKILIIVTKWIQEIFSNLQQLVLSAFSAYYDNLSCTHECVKFSEEKNWTKLLRVLSCE
jgi:hypothetical protein